MKKLLFAFVLGTVVCCGSKTSSNVESVDTLQVDTVQVDSMVVDTIG